MQQNQLGNSFNSDIVETDEDTIGVGSSKQSKLILIVFITIFVSTVIYFLFLKEPANVDNEVDTDALIVQGGGQQPTRTQAVDYNSTDLLDNAIVPEDNIFSPKTQDTIPALPELPSLTDEIKQQIAVANLPEKKEDTFTKEEVDKMIDERVKEMLEEQMANLSSKFTTQQQTQQEPTAGLPIKTENTSLNDIILPGDIGFSEDGKSDDELLAEQQKKEAETLEKIKKDRAMQERKIAPIFKVSSGTGPTNSLPQDGDAIILTYTDNKLDIQDKAPDVIPTQVTDLTRAILQGKVISAVLETAIDTDIQATVRAVITRDIYAEEGKNILIPKGSRVIGTYETNISAGQTRVTINWNRIIRVDGMSLNISSVGADRLGRAGVQGDLDNKYAQQLANSFLSSVLSVGTSLAVEKMSGSTGITNTISSLTGETTQTSGKASDYALIQATKDFMDDAQDIVDNIAKQKPVIRIPQGERVMIMVTQDLTLPIFKRTGK